METLSDFPGGGQTGALIRAIDWSTTPLGATESWPLALKGLVRALLHSRQPMLLWWGPQLIQLYNDAFLPSFGQGKHPTAMGQPARECWPEVWPVVGDQLERVVTEGDAIWFEESLVPVFRNGRVDDAWWTYSYSPVFDDLGQRAGVLIICTETTPGVTARRNLERSKKEAELAREEVRAAFSQAPLPIVILSGPDHVFTLANTAYQTLVGRPVLGKKLAEAFTDAEVAYYRPILDGVYRTGEPIVIREAELRLPDERGVVEDRYIDVSYQPYRNPELAILGIIAVMTDVTISVRARKALERQDEERTLTLAREQELRIAAEASGRQRDEFLAMLSHELRNPLAPIVTALGLMQLRGGYDKERLIIERQVTHLSKLVDDLLDVARGTRGKIELRRRPIAIAEVVATATETASPLLVKHGHTLDIQIPEGLVVDGDPSRLTQIFGNLIINAAKYTPPKGLIEVRAIREAHEIVVTVSDNGPGIRKELLATVFDLFVQGQQGIDRSQGGLGLGLALVKNLTLLHGGTVSAVNRPTGGCEVTVRLPASLAATRDLKETSATPPSPQKVRQAPRKILVVDDNIDAAQMLCDLLGIYGHDVAVAHNGFEALKTLESFPAEVGLLDLGLPGMDGFELARRIRAKNNSASLRLVAITGYGQNTDREGTRAAGFDFHLTKPVVAADVLRVIGKDLSQP